MFGTIALRLTGFVLIVTCVVPGSEPGTPVAITPGSRILMDAHNCYPYGGRWRNREVQADNPLVPIVLGKKVVSSVTPQERACPFE